MLLEEKNLLYLIFACLRKKLFLFNYRVVSDSISLFLINSTQKFFSTLKINVKSLSGALSILLKKNWPTRPSLGQTKKIVF